MSAVVHAVIVEKPNKDVDKWIKVIVFVHAAFSLYTAYTYKLHHVSRDRWWSLLISWLFLGVLIPLIGVRASERADKWRLSIFSGVQVFIGACNIINFLAFTSVLLQVIEWCSSLECDEQFAQNGSCFVLFANETVEMSESYCEDTDLNIGTSMGFALLALVSCMGGISARRMSEVKVAEVTYVEQCPVVPVDFPVAPEDQVDSESLVALSADSDE